MGKPIRPRAWKLPQQKFKVQFSSGVKYIPERSATTAFQSSYSLNNLGLSPLSGI